MAHVKETMNKHKGMKFKEVLKMAKKTYKKSSAKVSKHHKKTKKHKKSKKKSMHKKKSMRKRK